MSDFWVFGYGSLMWRPGFPHQDSRPARLFGMHRSLCIYSWVHRGTQKRPGLVLGLDKGGTCNGMAFHVKGHNREEVIGYLRAREMVTNVYREVVRTIHLSPTEQAQAVTYVVDPTNQQYAGKLSDDFLKRQVQGAKGQSGKNEDYIFQTVEQLRSMGIRDRKLELLAKSLSSPD